MEIHFLLFLLISRPKLEKCRSSHLSHPLWHSVSTGRAMVGIDHYDSDDDRSYDKHHGEQHVFANQGNGTGS